jgi:hypothetical protein
MVAENGQGGGGNEGDKRGQGVESQKQGVGIGKVRGVGKKR